jgi:ubiquinone biosynthesis protein UbiJ
MLQNLVNAFQPPPWVVDEIQNRVVLLINHVLSQEPQAQERLRRQQGKTARLVWGRFDIALMATPAGLLERPLGAVGRAGHASDLTVTLTQTRLPDVLQTVIKGDKPAVNIVNIEGDVQLAAEVAWLVDNLRWDLEDDLARLVGDVPAATLVRTVGLAADAVKAFGARWAPGVTAGTARTPSP